MPKRKYRVTSRSNTLGRANGEVFDYDFEKSPYDEGQLISRGAIERVKRGEERKDDARDSEK